VINKNDIPQDVFHVLNKLKTHGFTGFLVGGSVRDMLLGRVPKDFDICTDATPENIKAIFEKVFDTGLKFGTVTVRNGDISIEITTFRRHTLNSDGQRHTIEVYGKSELEDVRARDFTINALLYDGEKIIDYVHGCADLQNKVIRAVEQPDTRFSEDGLRMIRAIRLCCQLEFEIESNTYSSITKNSTLIRNVSAERIRDELVKILLSNTPAKGIKMLMDTGLLLQIIPELQACSQFHQQNPYHDKDVFEHTMAVLEHTPRNLIVRLAALFHDVGKSRTFSSDDQGIGHFYTHELVGFDITKQILSRLKFDNKTIDSVTVIIKEHMYRLYKLKNSSIKRLINRVGLDKIDCLIDLQIADEFGSKPPHNVDDLQKLRKEVHRILSEKEPLTLLNLVINGKDLINLGIQPGPKIGELLNSLLEKVINNPELNKKDTLLKIVENDLARME
jgi:tRNA nucleotidyltransferase (CCA-adding enzyme)